ncbi:DnaJ [Acrasis kona]|uniref:DnaJ n=1 Tax=Acrasis kona TaxID=1008807 RepID=A0AAW2Z1D1_9EUKA
MNEFSFRLSSYVSPFLKHNYALTHCAVALSKSNNRRNSNGNLSTSTASLHNTINNINASSPFSLKSKYKKREDLYAILGLSKSCSEREIRHAYKLLSKQYHPDHNPDGRELFENISEAYQVLCDPDKRQKYDQSTRKSIIEAPSKSNFESPSQVMSNSPVLNFDILHTVDCTLDELHIGISKRKFQIKRKRICSVCMDNNVQSCLRCCGKGFNIERNCVGVKIKKGMRSNQSFIYTSGGNEISKNVFSDLVFTIHQLPHDRYLRHGDHLLTNHKINIKDISQDGRILRIKNCGQVPYIKCVEREGMPVYNNENAKGNLFISLTVDDSINTQETHQSYVEAISRDVTTAEMTMINSIQS